MSRDSNPPSGAGSLSTADEPLFKLNIDEADPGKPSREASYAPFVPRRIGPFADRFHQLAQEMGSTPDDREAARDLVEAEIDWAQEHERGFVDQGTRRPPALCRYQASLSVLGDLLGQDWSWRYRQFTLELAPPDFTSAPTSPGDVTRQKAAIREAMQYERLGQLQPESVRRFIDEMERRDLSGRRPKYSVLDLVREGAEFARDLRTVGRSSGEAYETALQAICQPYLQLVEPNSRCAQTALRLHDIWRYFRYTWSIPYFSTPGRNLFYLIRDKAKPLHPVIGIAALGNSMMRLADRERHIGWDLEWVEGQVARGQGPARRAGERLYAAVVDAARAVNLTGVISNGDLAHPTPELVSDLAEEAKNQGALRKEALRQQEAAGVEGGRARGASSLTLAAEDEEHHVHHLFAQKRASDLSNLLRAQLAFLEAGAAGDPARALGEMLKSAEGRRALMTAVTEIKKSHIGTSMMDIIVCGAIPPYSHLLGGKLVCMLLASPQVRMDYFDRYSDAASEIASTVRGEDHIKPAELVFLGTTSLYHVGSSQYNRVKIPARVLGGAGDVRYRRLGSTRGYGSVHFSKRTRALLERAVREDKGATFITRTFGEGVNPKLRLTREGLATVGLDHDHFLRHQCRRIIYGVDLASNTGEFLRGEATEPDYLLPASSREEAERASQLITAYWARRWLAPRALRSETLQRVAESIPDDLCLSVEAERGRANAAVLRTSEPPPPPPPPAADASPSEGSPSRLGVEFIQKLYNHRSCYADRLTPEQLDAIHIHTPAEQFILDALEAGKDVVLTGNPGDGKTHLIMRLASKIKAFGGAYHADATAEESYAKLVEQWRAARELGKPFCLAINEWPLLELVDGYAEEFSPLGEVRAQVERGLVYHGDGPQADTVVVLDLNNRNLLRREVFDQLLLRLVSDRFYPECPSCPARDTCDLPKARAALREERVRRRIFWLLELVTKRGVHVTMRDLQGFVAYLLAGGRTCEELIQVEEPSPYSSLAFEGESDLFDAIREAFDPARITHPLHDELLWMGSLPGRGWTKLGAPLPPSSASADTLAAMRAAKRRFFFEHERGEDLAALLPSDELDFFEALRCAPVENVDQTRRVLSLINGFFDPHGASDGGLRIWTQHVFNAQWSPTYVSIREVPARAFSLQVPHLSASVKAAYSYQPDHLRLAATREGAVVARLMIDLPLFRTLRDAKRGLPMALRNGDIRKRLDLFFNELGRAFAEERDPEAVRIKNFETGEELRFNVDRRRGRYTL